MSHTVGFSNGRHRTRLAESVGMKSIPVAVEKGNEAALRALLKKFTGKDGAMSALDAAARALARDDVPLPSERGQRLMNTAT